MCECVCLWWCGHFARHTKYFPFDEDALTRRATRSNERARQPVWHFYDSSLAWIRWDDDDDPVQDQNQMHVCVCVLRIRRTCALNLGPCSTSARSHQAHSHTIYSSSNATKESLLLASDFTLLLSFYVSLPSCWLQSFGSDSFGWHRIHTQWQI